jgi:hypothetical protein
MSNDDELRDLLSGTAQEIKRLSSNPSTWQHWMVYLMKELEQQATNASPMDSDLYREMLTSLLASLRTRLRTGSW